VSLTHFLIIKKKTLTLLVKNMREKKKRDREGTFDASQNVLPFFLVSNNLSICLCQRDARRGTAAIWV
jgi:hypothetical protein